MQLIYKFIAVAVLAAGVGSGLTLVVVQHTSVVVNTASVGAAPDNGFKAKTYTYYHAHPDEARRRYEECVDKGIGGLGDTQESRDCMVAGEARN
jgi:hypothetical protein